MAAWLGGFQQRHGPVTATATAGGVALAAADGASARCHPLLWRSGGGEPVAELLAAAQATDAIGLVLVRRGGYAVGIAVGEGLVVSKVDSRYVQGRTAAGGRSQQRFARRREQQAGRTVRAAADLVAGLVLPRLPELATVVTGGDRQMVARVLADARLSGVSAAVSGRFLDVPDPRLAVLRAAARRARTVRVKLAEPAL